MNRIEPRSIYKLENKQDDPDMTRLQSNDIAMSTLEYMSKNNLNVTESTVKDQIMNGLNYLDVESVKPLFDFELRNYYLMSIYTNIYDCFNLYKSGLTCISDLSYYYESESCKYLSVILVLFKMLSAIDLTSDFDSIPIKRTLATAVFHNLAYVKYSSPTLQAKIDILRITYFNSYNSTILNPKSNIPGYYTMIRLKIYLHYLYGYIDFDYPNIINDIPPNNTYLNYDILRLFHIDTIKFGMMYKEECRNFIDYANNYKNINPYMLSFIPLKHFGLIYDDEPDGIPKEERDNVFIEELRDPQLTDKISTVKYKYIKNLYDDQLNVRFIPSLVPCDYIDPKITLEENIINNLNLKNNKLYNANTQKKKQRVTRRNEQRNVDTFDDTQPDVDSLGDQQNPSPDPRTSIPPKQGLLPTPPKTGLLPTPTQGLLDTPPVQPNQDNSAENVSEQPGDIASNKGKSRERGRGNGRGNYRGRGNGRGNYRGNYIGKEEW
jgi:hypothetical protein